MTIYFVNCPQQFNGLHKLKHLRTAYLPQGPYIIFKLIWIASYIRYRKMRPFVWQLHVLFLMGSFDSLNQNREKTHFELCLICIFSGEKLA